MLSTLLPKGHLVAVEDGGLFMIIKGRGSFPSSLPKVS